LNKIKQKAKNNVFKKAPPVTKTRNCTYIHVCYERVDVGHAEIIKLVTVIR